MNDGIMLVAWCVDRFVQTLMMILRQKIAVLKKWLIEYNIKFK